jgi:hypothetical protein
MIIFAIPEELRYLPTPTEVLDLPWKQERNACNYLNRPNSHTKFQHVRVVDAAATCGLQINNHVDQPQPRWRCAQSCWILTRTKKKKKKTKGILLPWHLQNVRRLTRGSASKKIFFVHTN